MRRQLVLCAALALSCAKGDQKAPAATVAQPTATDQATKPMDATPKQEVTARKIVHTGTIRLTVEAYESARQESEAIVTGAGGFVGSTRVSHGDGKVVAADLTLRIPAARFPEIVHRIRQLGRVLDEATNAEDVTDAWVDLEARLKNARQMETRLLEIVAKGPDKVADLLEVERELGRVRGEIEAYEGRLRVMRDQVDLGTLQLGLYTDAKYVPPTVGSRAVGTLERSWNALVSFAEGVFFLVLALLPWLPLLALATWLALRLRNRLRRQAVAAKPAA